jgi:pectate lyase
MKKFWMMLVFSLLFTLAACTNKPIPTTDPITPLPNEELPVDNSRLHNPFGFSSLIITNRSIYKDDIRVVNNAIEFLDALLDTAVKVIRIDEDLSLGSKTITADLTNAGKSLSTYSNVYRAHSRQPLTHPILKETGVGQVRLNDRSDLMIYSEKGIQIKHAAVQIERSSNIVIRNLHVSELWEWDEYSEGQYKRNDWDYFSLKDVNGVWFDHITFDQVYDGIIDLREYSQNVTLSWSKLNFTPNAFIDAQIDYLEENRSTHPYYDRLRTEGITK